VLCAAAHKTYCSTWSGIVYIAFVTDVFSRRIVGWKAARSMTTTLVLDALNMSAWIRRHNDVHGVICHSDAGSQYTSTEFNKTCRTMGLVQSMGTVGDSYDNALAESFWASLKRHFGNERGVAAGSADA
jgi:putative transposase